MGERPLQGVWARPKPPEPSPQPSSDTPGPPPGMGLDAGSSGAGPPAQPQGRGQPGFNHAHPPQVPYPQGIPFPPHDGGRPYHADARGVLAPPPGFMGEPPRGPMPPPFPPGIMHPPGMHPPGMHPPGAPPIFYGPRPPPPMPGHVGMPRGLMANVPEYLPGTASLFEQLDKQILVVLRDGRNLVGVLRSYDQYSNMVLEDTCERHVVNGKYGDIELGLFLVRGDSVVLLGEVDLEREKELTKVTSEEILEELQGSAGASVKLEWEFE